MNTIPEISVIISTYNSPKWLEKVLISYQYQDFENFEVVIADDGSTDETKKLLSKINTIVNYSINHVWHEDLGFRKTEILNKAILQCKADYLLFTDGDCLVRKDFVKTHMIHRENGFFLSGGYLKLPMSTSQSITFDDIKQQNCFSVNWLSSNGLPSSFKNNKITASKNKAKLLNMLTPTKATWNGHNASGWKKDILAVNGFDERMQYGGEDREMGERLFNLGIKAKQIRYSAICVHLDHKRGYVTPEMITKNKKIRKDTKEFNITRTPFGIEKL